MIAYSKCHVNCSFPTEVYQTEIRYEYNITYLRMLNRMLNVDTVTIKFVVNTYRIYVLQMCVIFLELG